MTPLAGRVAVVTGAASGIGRGIATALARAGMRTMLVDIEEPALHEAQQALAAEGHEVAAVRADVSVRADLEAAARATLARFGRVHVLVSNAGVGAASGYGQWTDASWYWVLGVNLRSVIWGTEIFAPLIEAHGEGGHIVNTASIAGLAPVVGPQYNVTKAGVVAFSETMRAALGRRGIGVSVLCPGVVRTRILESMRNVPERFQGAIETPEPTPETTEVLVRFAKAMAHGIDPLWVGELVAEAIIGDWPWIFTDTEFEPEVEARFAAIRQGFDRIRGRVPRRLSA
ncbi:MAG: SDR family NAD(P)-dependent oxidoreductase [Sphingomonadaceae bacterium]|uniref:SDR family NAD(P)-dependent oxidoreductase n=1 Tax=Thermaurantiacus sp. TaxID=2820283 RepID=UPI00298F2C2E|nr:SDR family NAD(P)-dependent oxidoreductase [Thermaurantiacus sp.]MCS6986318.1 SDR family NAD(P)-dependent oxidoreductase [Sphingomonadaceae bacterium]MDW8414420.1 SDR family NAD(P)-dependent oxidoreductase [Thermaurantiacus sp.]